MFKGDKNVCSGIVTLPSIIDFSHCGDPITMKLKAERKGQFEFSLRQCQNANYIGQMFIFKNAKNSLNNPSAIFFQ